MSLTRDDLQAIRAIIEEAINPVRGDIEALSNDVKEIYEMLADLQKQNSDTGDFKKINIEEKILRLHSELIEAARQAGVTLPSH